MRRQRNKKTGRDISKTPVAMSLVTVKLLSGVLGMALLAACGSGGASPSAKKSATPTIKAEACTDGEARETVLYVRNLNDFEWTGAVLGVAKGGKTYILGLQGEHTDKSRVDPIYMPPESLQPAEPFTDPSKFTARGEKIRRDLKQGGAPIIRLASFSHLESVTVELPAVTSRQVV